MTPCLAVESVVHAALSRDSKQDSDVKPSRNINGLKVSIGVGSGTLSPDKPVQETDESSILIKSLKLNKKDALSNVKYFKQLVRRHED